MAKKTNVKINDNDYFRIRATVGYDADGRQIQKSFYGKSKKEAEDKKQEYLNKIENGLNLDYESYPLRDLMKMWLFDVVKNKVSHSTLSRYEIVYRLHIAPAKLGSMKLNEIKAIAIQREYNKMKDSGKTRNIILSVNKILRSFFNYAMLQGFIIKNPCFGLTIPKAEDSEIKNEIDPFTDNEIKSIISHANSDIKPLIILAFATGLRQGELLGLRFCDIDLISKEINIKGSLKKVKEFIDEENYIYKTVLSEPKTKSSIRTVNLPDNVVEVLKTHIIGEKEKYLKLGKGFESDYLAFTTSSGLSINNRNLIRAWERLLKKANVRYRNFHNTRHTFASKLFEQGIPLKTIQTLLGHSSIVITGNIYTHILPKQKIDASNSISYLFENLSD